MTPNDLLELDDADLVDVLAADAFHGGDLIDRVRLSSWLVTLRPHERERMRRIGEIARRRVATEFLEGGPRPALASGRCP